MPIMLISVSPVVKVDSSLSVSNHVAHSRVCYRSSTDEPLSSCGTTIRRQEAVESTDGLKDLAP